MNDTRAELVRLHELMITVEDQIDASLASIKDALSKFDDLNEVLAEVDLELMKTEDEE